ncbi:MAG: putative membrane protein [Vicingaceae bacterium]|jgi:uncharacterized membrane protein
MFWLHFVAKMLAPISSIKQIGFKTKNRFLTLISVTNFSPYTKLKLFDWTLEATSLVIIGISWCYMLPNFADIPQTIPVHFDIQGKPDRFGDKSELFTLLHASTGLYLLLLLLSFFPQFHNIPTTLTEVNIGEKLRLSGRMTRMVNAVMCLIFLVLSATSV